MGSDETPSLLFNFAIDNGVDMVTCGSTPLLIPPDSCCVASLDLDETFDYSAAVFSHDPVSVGFTLVPAAANGHTYCLVEFRDSDASFKRMAYLQDSRCVEGVVLYADPTCLDTSLLTTITLSQSATDTTFNSTNLSARLWNVVGGTGGIEWTTNFQQLDIAALICCILSFLFPILFIIFILRSNKSKPIRNLSDKRVYMIIVQVFWIVYTALIICYWIIKFDSDLQWIILEQTCAFLSNVLTLYGVLKTLQ
ncbi:hypothetical protein HDU91_001915, partial [Kappamyces sp. JEL0680]